MTHYDTVARAIGYLADRADSPPSLEELAEYLRLTPDHVATTFAEWAGVTPKQFSRYLTLAYARETLARSRRSQLDVALELGLSSQSRLHDLFVDVEAMTPEEYRTRGEGLVIGYSFGNGLFGPYLVASTGRGICNILFAPDAEIALGDLRARWKNAELVRREAPDHRVIHEYFENGHRPKKIKLCLAGTNFQLKVWEALLSLPEGVCATYGSIAEDIGKPRAVRAVGTAVGDNPVSYVIPCHRVLRSTGEIGGYRWGLVRKRAMLGYEAARFGDAEGR